MHKYKELLALPRLDFIGTPSNYENHFVSREATINTGSAAYSA